MAKIGGAMIHKIKIINITNVVIIRIKGFDKMELNVFVAIKRTC
jgi:hypothetical protein